jgi:hypothetical protein
MKNWTKVFASAAFAIIGCIALFATASAQSFQTNPPDCQINVDQAALDNGANLNSTGAMGLVTNSVSNPTDPIQWQTLTAVTFSATTSDPGLGQVEWSQDNSRPAPTTRIESNQPGALFPATVDLQFNVRATFSSQPEVVFLSRTPAQLQAVVNSWAPFAGEVFTLVSPVEFFRQDAPEETAFTVTQLSSTLN